MHIVYLDQNKWIELARAFKNPAADVELARLAAQIAANVEAGKLILPLSWANIYETYKIQNPNRRHELAYVQTWLSRGTVFRGRRKRLEVELSNLLAEIEGKSTDALPDLWYLSSIFIEAFAELDDERIPPLPGLVVDAIRENPAGTLFSFLTEARDEGWIEAIRRYSFGSDQLRARIEKRRGQHAGESKDMRRRIYSALLLIDELDFVIKVAKKTGRSWATARDMGSKVARRIVEDVPGFYSEREMAVILEALNRPIQENDFRDMQSFCAAVAYADEVIGEKMFVNLARQAKLDGCYGTVITSDLRSIAGRLA